MGKQLEWSAPGAGSYTRHEFEKKKNKKRQNLLRQLRSITVIAEEGEKVLRGDHVPDTTDKDVIR